MTGVGCRAINSRKKREAVHLRHLEIERDDVGLQLKGHLQPLFAVAGATDDLELGHTFEHRGDRLAVERRVVDDEDANGLVVIHSTAFCRPYRS